MTDCGARGDDELARLRAENERLRAENKGLRAELAQLREGTPRPGPRVQRPRDLAQIENRVRRDYGFGSLEQFKAAIRAAYEATRLMMDEWTSMDALPSMDATKEHRPRLAAARKSMAHTMWNLICTGQMRAPPEKTWRSPEDIDRYLAGSLLKRFRDDLDAYGKPQAPF